VVLANAGVLLAAEELELAPPEDLVVVVLAAASDRISAKGC
jgi:hypothetical protein